MFSRLVTRVSRLIIMKHDLPGHDRDSLKRMLDNESKQLTEALLQGAAWDAVVNIRRRVTLLSQMVDREKTRRNDNPAENIMR